MKNIPIFLLFVASLFAKDIIAVLDLEETGLTSEDAIILTQRLTTKLIAIDRYHVVERSNMDKILNEQKFQKSGCTDSECAVEIGQMLNTDYIVIGTVSKFHSTYAIDARLIDVAQGKNLISAEFSMEGKIDELLTTGMTSIAQQLSKFPLINTKQSTQEDLIIIDEDTVANNSTSKRNTGSHMGENVKGINVFGLGIFSGFKRTVVNEQVKGGVLISIFGGGSLNMMDAALNKRKNIIYLITIFGGCSIVVPRDMYIKDQVIPIFGGFSNKTKFIKSDNSQLDQKLIIRGVTIFGGASVKNGKKGKR